ncbi:MAG TPA: biotin--[acetyl-CoA-carboxylase] ligase [Gemmatimonadales bacterium]|nr:biotin--[acetyl-CoA-carboxylase] ligase [Gemmatimonadales bacterium]
MPLILDGVPAAHLARRWAVPQVAALRLVASTLDTAHELGASGAAHGTTVIAEEQTAGRGRDGRRWHSPVGGVWLSMLVRSPHADLRMVSLRAGLVVADALDELLGSPRARLKWPNDVLIDDRKIAGVLSEGRWQGNMLQWLAVGIGINVWNDIPPQLAHRAVSLREFLPDIRRLDVLDRLVPGITAIGASAPHLSESESRAFAERDWLRGRVLRAPVAGRASGIRGDGALLVESGGAITPVLDGHVDI